jgi:hypothetical protein
MPSRNGGNNRGGARRRGAPRPGQMGNQQNARSRMPNTIMLKPSYTTPYKFSRSFDLGNLTKGAADQGYAFPFTLSQLPAYLEFANLFDKYRITSIDLTFSYSVVGETDVGTTTSFHLWPALYLYMDDDDATIPTTKSEVLERMSVQRVSMAPTRQTISVTIRPRWVQSRVALPVSANLAPVNSWLDMATPAVPHYGVKLWADNYNTSTVSGISLSGVMHFECNNVR